MKHDTAVARVTDGETGLARITRLEQQLALVPVNSLEHRRLSAAIRIEAHAYRKILDREQAQRHTARSAGRQSF